MAWHGHINSNRSDSKLLNSNCNPLHYMCFSQLDGLDIFIYNRIAATTSDEAVISTDNVCRPTDIAFQIQKKVHLSTLAHPKNYHDEQVIK